MYVSKKQRNYPLRGKAKLTSIINFLNFCHSDEWRKEKKKGNERS